MSEKRSWDIQPKQKAPAPAPRPVAPQASVSRPRVVRQATRPQPRAQTPTASRPVAVKSPRQEKIPQGREREPLKDRRRRARRRASTVFSILFILIIIGIFVVLWLPTFRVQKVNAAGPDSDGVQSVAMSSLAGRDYYVFPRDSIFFFPETTIRANILSQYPDLSAVAISRSSFNSISIASVPRTQSFIWCGTSYAPHQVSAPVVATSTAKSTASVTSAPVELATDTSSNCYSVDGQGVLFAPASSNAASGSSLLTAYAPLNGDVTLGSTLTEASQIPSILQFIKILRSLNAGIVLFVIRGDEADFYTQGGTRITYVIGREAMAEQLAESSFSSLNLNDGSLEYVDLRFDGKVYFKKVGSDAQTTSPAH